MVTADPERLAELVEETRLRAVRAECLSLRRFVELAWRYVDPKGFVANWHHDAVCEHLEAVTRGEVRDLRINIPPRHTKSLIASVLWPAWEWGPGGKPQTRWLTASYAMQLAVRDCVKARRLIGSPWYQALWPIQWEDADNLKSRYLNTKGGHRIATAVNSAVTGEGGDRLVVDDPHNVMAITDASLDKDREWWDTAMSTRGDDAATVSRVIIMQRLHQRDLSGHTHAEEPGEWTVLCLPAEYEPNHPFVYVDDPRKKDGELLYPARFPRSEIDKLKKRLGSYGAAGQLQQRPSPRGGGMFKRDWWKRAPRASFPELEECDILIASWDLPFKGKKTSDNLAGFVLGRLGGKIYAYARVKTKAAYTKQRALISDWIEEYPLDATLIEDAANGAAVVDELRQAWSGVLAIPARGAKETRAEAYSPMVEAGSVVLPSDEAWADDVIEEHASFPAGEYDDQVDALGQGCRYLKRTDFGVS